MTTALLVSSAAGLLECLMRGLPVIDGLLPATPTSTEPRAPSAASVLTDASAAATHHQASPD